MIQAEFTQALITINLLCLQLSHAPLKSAGVLTLISMQVVTDSLKAELL